VVILCCIFSYYNRYYYKHFFYSWNKLLNYMCDEPFVHGDRLKDKERAIIKERFAGFNREIEDISKVQRGYSIPDIELRESIKRDNKELVIPKYNAFFNRYKFDYFTELLLYCLCIGTVY